HPSWLQIAVTVKAKSSIKTILKEESTSELIQLGEYLLTNALQYQGGDKPIDDEKWQRCLEDLKCTSKEELYMKIGLSEILVSIALNKLQSENGTDLIKSINIRQTKGKSISFAHCCYPIPGDKVAGILTSTKGLVMHRFDCGNLIHAKQKNEQWLEIDWKADGSEEFEALIRVQVENRRGMLASIANVIAKININIEHLEVEEKDHSMKALNLVIGVANISQLDEAMYEIKSLEFVQLVERI
ncbi:MAG: (p)ppGpp synthetase, partial [Candidatus Thioglobus sp.]